MCPSQPGSGLDFVAGGAAHSLGCAAGTLLPPGGLGTRPLLVVGGQPPTLLPRAVLCPKRLSPPFVLGVGHTEYPPARAAVTDSAGSVPSQKCIPHSSGGWEVPSQGAGWAGLILRPLLWAGGWPPSRRLSARPLLCACGVGRKSSGLPVAPYKDTSSFRLGLHFTFVSS